MKTAIYSIHAFEKEHLESATLGKHELFFIDKELTAHTAEMARGCKAVALFTSDNASAAVLEQLKAEGIQYITLRSAGYDHVDLQAAKKLGMRVANVPAYSPYAVAEHAVTLLMALNRKIIPAQERMRIFDYRLDGLTGFDIHGKTVGIAGFGKIGQAFARIMNGFGCKVLAYDPYFDQQSEWPQVEFVTFGELCKLSDIISIHCPLNEHTRHLFNRQAFCLMKENVYLINTARGPVINTDDLLDFLEQGKIGAVGLDVYEFEKGIFFQDRRKDPPADLRLKKLQDYPNVLITGHQAFLTHEALQNISATTAYNLSCFEKNIPCPNELT